MTVYMLVAAIVGSTTIAFFAVAALYHLGCFIAGVVADWREFSAAYDAAHRPERIDVTNVRVHRGGAM